MRPWATGPGEILRHALELLQQDSDSSRRISMILIDNAIELTLKTYLSLPKRVTGIKLTRSQLADAKRDFPSLLDAMEEHADQQIEGVDFGELEWYHRLRNQLYHEGNGLTVEKERVRVYAELANVLFERLFGEELVESEGTDHEDIGRFIHGWSIVENTLVAVAKTVSETTNKKSRTPRDAAVILLDAGIVDPARLHQIDRIQASRNRVVHGHLDQANPVTPELLADLEDLLDWIEEIGKRLC